ncbi:hypothetical protein B9T62_18120 [Paenibacillus donghaensis]|uniref:Uncharacterized protein n=1 Tax=Paenibacillus donghaensis TaxID=414771 RepID=A0A2Z2KT65_9BACL|nr:hypothetical protein B9T62_18120 [Paenibacillus donghaensis]
MSAPKGCFNVGDDWSSLLIYWMVLVLSADVRSQHAAKLCRSGRAAQAKPPEPPESSRAAEAAAQAEPPKLRGQACGAGRRRRR